MVNRVRMMDKKGGASSVEPQGISPDPQPATEPVPRPATEPGVGTAGVALAILAAALVAVGMLQLFYTAWERMDVRNAADLAAVSGAIVLRDTGSVPEACARARDIATGMNVTCAGEGGVITVVVGKEPRFEWLAGTHKATAVAGPADQFPGE